MTDEHDRYVALAVGHVLGGLDAVDAAAFRSHLQGCRECRSRVAELRGIAASLDAVARDERFRGSVRTELPRRVEHEESPPADPGAHGVTVRQVTVAVVLVLALAAATAFWNFHLRTVVATASLAAEQRDQTLVDLAEGVPVEATFAEGLRGLVVVGDDRAAFVLTGLPPLNDGERLVATISGGALARPQVIRVADAARLDRDAFSAGAATHGAQRLTVTREPAGREEMTLLEADIGAPSPLAGR